MVKFLAFFISYHVVSPKMDSVLARFRGMAPRHQKFKSAPSKITGADISFPLSSGRENALSGEIERDWVGARPEEGGWTTKDCPLCDEFRNELDRADDRQVEHGKLIDDLKQQLTDLKTQEQRFRQHFKKQESKIEKMEGAQTNAEMRHQAAQSKLHKALEEIDTLKSELYETEQRCGSLTDELSASEKTNNQFRQLLKARSATQDTDDLEAENARLTAENSALVRQVKVARGELQAATGSSAKSKSTGEKELNALRAENDKLTAENAALVRQANVARTELQAGKASSAKLKSTSDKDLSAVRAENDKLSAENAALVRQVNVVQAELRDAKSSVPKAKPNSEKDSSVFRAENDKLKSKLQDAQDEIKKLSLTRSDSTSKNQGVVPSGTAQGENDQLQSKLEAENDHILSLGSKFGMFLSRKDAAKEFKVIREGVRSWYETYVEPTISNAADRLEVFSQAHQSGAHLLLQGDAQDRRLDFMSASKYADTDMDIVSIIIHDFLAEHIFSDEAVYGDDLMTEQMDLIKVFEQKMASDATVANGVYTARQWTSQARGMLLDSPGAKQIRECFADLMVDRLLVEMGLALFVEPPVSSSGQEARAALRKDIIVPAIDLQTKFMCAINKFTVEVNAHPPISNSSERSDSTLNWDDLNCKNVGEGPKRVKLDDMRHLFTDDVIQQNLKVICVRAPALTVRKAEDSHFGPPVILVKQELLVAWRVPPLGSSPDEEPVLAEEDRGLMWLLFRKYFPTPRDTTEEDSSTE